MFVADLNVWSQLSHKCSDETLPALIWALYISSLSQNRWRKHPEIACRVGELLHIVVESMSGISDGSKEAYLHSNINVIKIMLKLYFAETLSRIVA